MESTGHRSFLDYEIESLYDRCRRAGTRRRGLPDRESAEVTACHAQPGPDRSRPRPMDGVVEARAELLRRHLW
jgi:hypothetical protein